MLHLSQSSSDGSQSETLAGSSLSPQNRAEIPSEGGRNEVKFIPQKVDPGCIQIIDGQLNTSAGDSAGHSITKNPLMVSRTHVGILDGEQNLQRQGLSLSLSSEISSTVSAPVLLYQFQNPGFSSILSSHFPSLTVDGCSTMPCKGDQKYQSDVWRSDRCVQSDLHGGNHDVIKLGALDKAQCSINSQEMYPIPYPYEPSSFVNTIISSKYLKAAQHMLDEIVNVREALKQPKVNQHENLNGFGLCRSKETDERSNCSSIHSSADCIPSDPNESTTNSSCDLSPAERQDLQNKKANLLSMLDDVDRRYRQYHHEMQIVVASFDMVAGCGAAKPYTALALQAISCHFRCLRDGITCQIQMTQKKLGEQDTSPIGGGGIIRLRYVDQQLKQRRALQQLGVMQHAWRPQRGLPESSVSILRAWLFEHFLHPYPKDSEKIMLAKQTGLTRSQVANWFINARVRLWKPMVEEMYKEEFGDLEMNSKSSSDNAPKSGRDNSWTSETKAEEFQHSVLLGAADGSHPLQSHDSKSDVDMKRSTSSGTFWNGAHGDDVTCGIMQLQVDQRSNVIDHGLYPDEIIPSDQNVDGGLVAAAAVYQDLDGFSVGSQVSLALGLRHCESDVLSVSSGTHFRGADTTASSVGPDAADYHCLDPGNPQHRFGKPQVLHEVV